MRLRCLFVVVGGLVVARLFAHRLEVAREFGAGTGLLEVQLFGGLTRDN